jgi:hypothetical protein
MIVIGVVVSQPSSAATIRRSYSTMALVMPAALVKFRQIEPEAPVRCGPHLRLRAFEHGSRQRECLQSGCRTSRAQIRADVCELHGRRDEALSVRARGSELYVIADAGSEMVEGEGVHILNMPENYGLLSPVLHVVPLQLLAYHAALVKGTDVDKPRNLAKSVTVE